MHFGFVFYFLLLKNNDSKIQNGAACTNLIIMVCMLRHFDALFPKLRTTRHNNFYQLLRPQTMKHIFLGFFLEVNALFIILPEVMSLDTKLLVLGHPEWGNFKV